MLPLSPNQQPRLYAAALKLLRFAIGLNRLRFRTEVRSTWGAMFGAGKTRSAAVLLPGLQVFDPSQTHGGHQRKCCSTGRA